jgi:hypothetical protein
MRRPRRHHLNIAGAAAGAALLRRKVDAGFTTTSVATGLVIATAQLRPDRHREQRSDP